MSNASRFPEDFMVEGSMQYTIMTDSGKTNSSGTCNYCIQISRENTGFFLILQSKLYLEPASDKTRAGPNRSIGRTYLRNLNNA